MDHIFRYVAKVRLNWDDTTHSFSYLFPILNKTTARPIVSVLTYFFIFAIFVHRNMIHDYCYIEGTWRS